MAKREIGRRLREAAAAGLIAMTAFTAAASAQASADPLPDRYQWEPVGPSLWDGTVTLERDRRRGPCSTVKSEIEFTITVGEDRNVSGFGELRHSGYTCLGGYTAPAIHGPVTIGGKREGKTFTLFLNSWPAGPVARIPVGQWTVELDQWSWHGEATFPMGDMNDVVFRAKLWHAQRDPL